MNELLERLIQTPGVPGYEDQVRSVILESLPEGVSHDTDAIGNFTVAIGRGRKAMLFAAHMDEIGFVVSDIRDDGSVKLKPLGGVDPRTVFGRALRIVSESGECIGVVGVRPPHLMRDRAREMAEVPPVTDLLVDVGASSREEVQGMGVNVLDFAVLHKAPQMLNDRFLSVRGLDDRAGCYVLLEAIRQLHETPLSWMVQFAFTVQEEVGLRGAEALSRRLELEMAFAVDSISAGDNPLARRDHGSAVLGDGPCLRVIDNRGIVPQSFTREIRKVAERANLPCQVAFTGGGTDMAPFQAAGCHSMAIGIPMRYTHSAVEMIDTEDLDNTVRFVCEIVRRYAGE